MKKIHKKLQLLLSLSIITNAYATNYNVQDYEIRSQADVDALHPNGGQMNFKKRMIITKGGTYDFKNTLFYWNGPGTCGAPENQPYIMRISASNVTVKNFGYKNAPDGIHIGTADDGQGYRYGDKITNIHLDNIKGWACEAGMHTQMGATDILISNSVFRGNPNYAEADKIFQLNFSDVTFDNVQFYDSQVCVMFKGNQTITIKNSYFSGCERGVVGETLEGIMGHIGTGPSIAYSSNNVADMPSTWFNWRNFLVANDSKISIYSDQDVVKNGILCKANNGGHCYIK